MSYPTGITPVTGRIGKSVMAVDGDATGLTAVITPVILGVKRLTHAPSGDQVALGEKKITATAGEAVTFQVIPVDHPNLKDGAGNLVTGWSYKVQITQVYGPKKSLVLDPVYWSPLASQTGIIDVDLIPDGSVAVPELGNVPAVTSVGGKTGEVSAADIFDVIELDLAAKIQTVAPIVFKPEQFGAIGDHVADDTDAVNAAIAMALAAGPFAVGNGAVWLERCYLMLGRMILPHDGASSYPLMGSIKFCGPGTGYANPVGGSGVAPAFLPGPGTLDMRWFDPADLRRAKIAGIGTGTLELDGVNLYDGGNSSNPFVKVTNTRLIVRSNVSAMGNPSKFRGTCDQDVFVFGGNTPAPNGASSDDEDGPFQGYGSLIEAPQFHRIRSAVKFGMYANGNTVKGLNIWASCGSNDDSIGAIQMAPEPGDGSSIFGNTVELGLCELAGYKRGIVVDNAQGNTISGHFFDPDESRTDAAIYFASVDAKLNTVLPGYCRTATHPYALEAVPGTNTIIDGNDNGKTQFIFPPTFAQGAKTEALYNLGAGVPEMRYGGGSNPPGEYVINAGAPAFTAPAGSTCRVKNAALGRGLWFKQYGTDGAGWVCVTNFARTTKIKTASYVLLIDDEDTVVFNGASLDAILPSAVSAELGRTLTIKNVHSTALTVIAQPGQTVDGAAPATIAQWGVRRFMSDGANWLTI